MERSDAPMASLPWRHATSSTQSTDIPMSSLFTIKIIWGMFWPTFLSFLFQYSMNLISIAFSGHLGKDELAAVGIAGSICTITGIAVISGFTSACDSLGSQAYGAKNYKQISLVVQKGLIIMIIAYFPIWAILINVDYILVLAGQPPSIIHKAWLYLMIFSPAIIGMIVFRLLRSYMQVQGFVKPITVTCFVCTILHILFNYILVNRLKFGIKGAAVASVLSFFSLPCILFIYIYVSKFYQQKWYDFSKESFSDWGSYVRLGLSGLAGELLLFSGSEATIFIMGVVGEAELGAQAILFQLRTVLGMVSIGIALSISILVGNELGASRPKHARQMAKLGLFLSMAVNLVLALLLIGTKDLIGKLFTAEKLIIKLISQTMPCMATDFIAFCGNNVTGGILIGCAKQKVFAVLFFIGCYVIGLPLGTVLAFPLKMGIVGMWLGTAVGMLFQMALSLYYIFWILDFDQVSINARNLAIDDLGFSEELNTDILEASQEINFRLLEFNERDKSSRLLEVDIVDGLGSDFSDAQFNSVVIRTKNKVHHLTAKVIIKRIVTVSAAVSVTITSIAIKLLLKIC